jgi:DNA helicase-2/ATP-dependent DNA helicase PcrA
MKDLSLGPSWLGFAERPETRHNREALSSLRGDSPPPVKKTSNYGGKTYNSAESVRDFFKLRDRTGDDGRDESSAPGRTRSEGKGGGKSRASESGFRLGARVRHARYGLGVVLRVEGAGEDAKLTVSFPGYGQKKFVAKYAQLEKQ